MTTGHQDDEKSDLGQHDLVDGLVQLSFITMAVLSRVSAENDLSLTQLRVLGILRDRRLRMSALADYLGLEKSTLSGLVHRAEQRGLVRRAPGADDGRTVEVFLTAEGSELADSVFTGITTALSPMTGALAPAAQRRTTVTLRQMLAAGGGF